jgi:hypothetical protein
MRIRARVVVLAAMLAAFFGTAATGSAAPPQQQKQKEVKLDKAQQQEIQTAVTLVDNVLAGEPAPSDFPITWQFHFQKARDQRTFMPVTVAFPQAQISNPSVVYYIRVVERTPATPAPSAPKPGEDQDEKQKPTRPEYPFEDIRFTELKAPEEGQYRITRAISVPPGDFDIYLLVKERTPKDKKAPAPKASLLKQAVTVPDYWSNELMTSSIIISSRAEQLAAPPSEAEMAANPYVFGTTRVTPSLDNRFSKKDELSIIFLIYNAVAASGGKPDVKVEYNFHQKAGDGEKFFNRTEPQLFNATTLPPQFDAAVGHQLVGGLSIPLASFPEGDYRLEIRITDVAGNNKTKTESISLTVTT